jgi:predicted house-cleaning noncanonical NTP pyrophosphatase (MazG superfamily)
MIHNKLVRDKIPEIIKESGKKCKTKVLSEKDYVFELERKLSEEVHEYKLDKNPDELCDVIEVVYAIAEARGMSVSELEAKRIAKRESRGGFDGKVYLIEAD